MMVQKRNPITGVMEWVDEPTAGIDTGWDNEPGLNTGMNQWRTPEVPAPAPSYEDQGIPQLPKSKGSPDASQVFADIILPLLSVGETISTVQGSPETGYKSYSPGTTSMAARNAILENQDKARKRKLEDLAFTSAERKEKSDTEYARRASELVGQGMDEEDMNKAMLGLYAQYYPKEYADLLKERVKTRAPNSIAGWQQKALDWEKVQSGEMSKEDYEYKWSTSTAFGRSPENMQYKMQLEGNLAAIRNNAELDAYLKKQQIDKSIQGSGLSTVASNLSKLRDNAKSYGRIGGIAAQAGAAAGFNPYLKVYNDAVNGMIGVLRKQVAQEGGVMTDRDATRLTKLFSITSMETPEERGMKDTMWNNFVNQSTRSAMDAIQSIQTERAGGEGGAGDRVPTITTRAEYDALPSGAAFIQNGQRRRKP